MDTLKVLWADLTSLTEEQYARLLEQLPAARRERAIQYKQIDDRHRSIAAGILLQRAMDRAGIADDARGIILGPQGKPALDAGANFHFSLSHSGSIVLCAYGSTPMGADVEEPGRAHPRIVERKCPPVEWQWLQAQPDPDAAFFRLWVLKEAYVKAIGTGLTLGLDRYEICFGEQVQVLRDGIIEPWQFHETVLNGYPAAVCGKNPDCEWEEIRV